MKFSKVILFSVEIVCLIFILWFILSFFDVVMNNGLSGNGPQFSWNMFSVLLTR